MATTNSNVSVSLRLDKGAFYGGDVLTGMVLVAVVEPVDCKEVIVSFSGREDLRYRESVQDDGRTKSVERTRDNTVINTTVVIEEINGEVQPGEHAYPFSIELPEDLPGQFSFVDYHDGMFTHNASAYDMSVQYEIYGKLRVSDPIARWDIPSPVQAVIIYQRLPSQKLKPSHDSGRRMVYFLCCIQRGTCKLTASLDQATYSPGDTAIVHIQVKNDSQVNVTSLRCSIVQDMTVIKNNNSKVQVPQLLALRELAGIPVGQTVTYDEEIVLATKDGNLFPPSMRGTLFECTYRLELECDLPWCPDFELHLPMTLVAATSELRDSGVIVHGTVFPDVA